MIVNVSSNNIPPIDFGATGSSEIIQNVATLLNTMKYSVPYTRKLGLTGEFIDKPLVTAKALLTSEIIELIEEKEPRAVIVEVLFDYDSQEGILIPIVRVDINE